MTKILAIGLLALLAILFIRNKVQDKKSAEVNLQKGSQFMLENKANPDIVETTSGLQYLIIQEGTGEHNPGPESTVKVHYHGTLIDGTVFDSSVDRGEPISFALNRVIPGWTEGLQTMVVGEKRKLFIPAGLGYGNQSVGPIAPGSTLIFEVELLEIL